MAYRKLYPSGTVNETNTWDGLDTLELPPGVPVEVVCVEAAPPLTLTADTIKKLSAGPVPYRGPARFA